MFAVFIPYSVYIIMCLYIALFISYYVYLECRGQVETNVGPKLLRMRVSVS